MQKSLEEHKIKSGNLLKCIYELMCFHSTFVYIFIHTLKEKIKFEFDNRSNKRISTSI